MQQNQNGPDAATYAGGTAYTTGLSAATNSLTMDVIRDGDHVFVVDMAIPEPATLVLLRRRRQA